MAIKPILFNTEMVWAILDGRKSCTRRIVKGYIPKDAQFGYSTFTPDGTISCRGLFETTGRPGYGEKFLKLPYQPGDILYVRETWSEWTDGYVYKAWNSPFPQAGKSSGMKWHPSIHMPKEAARIWLKVTNVRVEKLQEMSGEDCEREGFENFCKKCTELLPDCDNCINDVDIKEEFKELWNSTIKKPDLGQYGWDANPWVWVIEFERCEKPE